MSFWVLALCWTLCQIQETQRWISRGPSTETTRKTRGFRVEISEITAISLPQCADRNANNSSGTPGRKRPVWTGGALVGHQGHHNVEQQQGPLWLGPCILWSQPVGASLKKVQGNFLVFQCLGPSTLTSRVLGPIPTWGSNTPQVT